MCLITLYFTLFHCCFKIAHVVLCTLYCITASLQEAFDIHLPSSVSVIVLVFLGPQVSEFLKAYPKPHIQGNVHVVIKVPG